MNGNDVGSGIGSEGFPVYQLLLIILDVVVVAAIVVGEVFIGKGLKKQSKQESAHNE